MVCLNFGITPGSLSFTMTRDHEQYESLQKMSTCITVEQDDKEIWRGRVLSHEADWYNRRVIYCEGALSYFNDSAITPFNYEGKLAHRCPQPAVRQHGDETLRAGHCHRGTG